MEKKILPYYDEKKPEKVRDHFFLKIKIIKRKDSL